jgi:hypothetical protein
MKVTRVGYVATLTLALVGSIACSPPAEAAPGLNAPLMAADPNWPKPLPNGWILGQVGGTCIDANDHVFVVTRGFQNGGLTAPEGVGGANPNTGALGGSFKSRPAPPVVEFDPAGNVVNSWGDPSLVPAGTPPPVGTNSIVGQNAVVPNGMHGCYVDYLNNVWIGGNSDGAFQRYSHDGVFQMQIGQKFKCDDGNGGAIPCTGTGGGNIGNTGTNHPQGFQGALLNLPAALTVDPNPDPVTGQRGSVYIADGYGNHRVAVFDYQGNFLRQFGSVGTGPDQFTSGDGGHPHCVRLGADQLIYACDRGQNKINVYTRSGQFVGNIMIVPGQLGTGNEGTGTAWDIDFSKDPNQTFAFISDGQNEVLWTFDHAGSIQPPGGAAVNPTPLRGFGRPGHDPGTFTFLHMMAIDSKGNIYVGETVGGNRIQKLITKTVPGGAVTSIGK